MKHLYETLKERGYIYQMTHEEEIKELLNSEEPFHFYMGIDPTADDLHIGHFFALMVFRYLQDAGNKGILLVGGATAMVGDPTGKTDMRAMMTQDQVNHNVNEVTEIAKKFIKTEGENAAIIVNNSDWMNGYDYIRFLRDVGVHFNVNTMLQAETYANRLKEGGLTFLEMGYMLMQAYDFVHLNRTHNCILQIGGSDQWGNIVAGVNLGRKLDFAEGKERKAFFGMTNPLLMNSEGKKMGKTEKGALWVSKDKTSAYDFYQYFYNVDDADVENLLKLFTKLPLDEIDALIKKDILEAKRRMAFEITKLVHGEEEAKSAVETAKALFSGGATKDAPLAEVALADFEGEDAEGGKNVLAVDVVSFIGMTASKSEARRLIKQGGVSVDGEKLKTTDDKVLLQSGAEFMFKVGKKKYMKVVVK